MYDCTRYRGSAGVRKCYGTEPRAGGGRVKVEQSGMYVNRWNAYMRVVVGPEGLDRVRDLYEMVRRHERMSSGDVWTAKVFVCWTESD